jgi:hypothetical protein
MYGSSLRASCFAAAIVAVTQLASAQDTGTAKPPVIHEKKDASGRLITRVVFNPDGTIHHTAIAYGPRASKLTINVDLDAVREPIAQTRETLDEDGRIVEREDMTVTDGVKLKIRTKYNYDAAGRQTTKTEVVE